MKTKLVALVVGCILFVGHTGAAVIGHANLDGVVYFADDDASSTLLRYEVASEASLSSVSLDGTPTAIVADSLGVYVGLGQSLYKYTFPSGVATRQLLRHFPKDIKAIEAVGDYLLVVTGNPSQTVTVISRLDGSLKNATVFEEDKFGIISGLHYSADNGYIIVNFSAEVDGTVFLTAAFDVDNATFGAFEASAVNKFSTPFFFEGAKLIVGEAGELVQFGGTGVTSLAVSIDTENPFHAQSTHEVFYSDGSVKVAFDDVDTALIGTSISNNCHEFDTGTTIRRVSLVNPGATASLGYTSFKSDVVQHSFDVNADIHSIVADGDDYLLFSGAGGSLVMTRFSDLEDPDIFGSGDFTPLTTNFSPDQNLSAISKDRSTLMMHIEATCDRHIVRWNIDTQTYMASVNMALNKPIDTSYSEKQNKFYSLNNINEGILLRYVDFDIALPADNGWEVIFFLGKGTSNQVIATDDFVVLSYKDAVGELLVVMTSAGAVAAGPTVNAGKAWDVGVWDSVHRRIYYLSDSSLFSVEIGVDGVFGAEKKSLHYGVIQEASVESEITLNSDATRLMVGGAVYDTESLTLVDAVGATSNLSMWLGAEVYTMQSGVIAQLENWTMDLGEDNHFGSVTYTALTDTNILLFPMMQGGTLVPMTVTKNGVDALTYRTHGETSTSVTLGGNGDSGAGSDTGADSSTGTDSSQPAEPLGGSGGGSIDYMYLLLLTLGFAIKRRKLN